MLCSYFICPIVIKAYNNQNFFDSSYNEGFHMIYTSISLGIGFFFGLIAGIFRCFLNETNNLSDLDFFTSKYMTHTGVRPAFPVNKII